MNKTSKTPRAKATTKVLVTSLRNAKGSRAAAGSGGPANARSASAARVDDWRSHMLARVRTLINAAVPEAVEEVKWRKPSNSMLGVPVWSSRGGGIICTGETYKNAVKLTFAKGASLPDPSGLFNSSLQGGTRRAIDLHEGDTIDEAAFTTLVRAAAAATAAAKKRATKAGTTRSSKRTVGAVRREKKARRISSAS